ncbi:MAG: PAS domain-containing protein, partial [Prolixibacteraceae bacterium]|nr:PAS domain-containing protein [Prolixibacteraceae bacterium]
MKKKPQTPLTEGEILRQKAEEQLKRKSSKTDLKRSEEDAQKVVNELQVHQIELEIQNEELVQANVDEGVATQKYAELYDFAPSGYFTLSKEGKITMLNLKGASMLGKERQRLINNTFGLLVSHNTRQIFNNFLSKAFEGKQDESCEVTISIDDNKQPLYVILTGHVPENSGECQMTMVDITKRKQAEEALHHSYVFNETILKTIPFGMDIVDESGTVLFQSDSLKKIFGESAIGQKCWDLYRDDKKQCSDCPLFKGITIDETDVYESHGIRGNRIFDISHTGMMFEGKKAMLEIFQDITERKQAEEELSMKNSMLNTLLANLHIGVYMIEVPSGKPLLANEASFNLLGRGILPDAHSST